jgi:hypothetical protein
MYMVYWTEVEDGVSNAHGKAFDAHEMRTAMHFMEELRTRQRNGGGVCFVAMSSENPHSVGHPGVAEPPAGYNWNKRRP